jgi:hypothetical protein
VVCRYIDIRKIVDPAPAEALRFILIVYAYKVKEVKPSGLKTGAASISSV